LFGWVVKEDEGAEEEEEEEHPAEEWRFGISGCGMQDVGAGKGRIACSKLVLLGCTEERPEQEMVVLASTLHPDIDHDADLDI